TYEDEGLTEYTGILADRSQSRACRACYGNTAADTGKSGNKSCCQISKTGRKSRIRSCAFCRLYISAAKHHNRRNYKAAEEEKYIYSNGAFVAFFVLLADQVVAEWNDNA